MLLLLQKSLTTVALALLCAIHCGGPLSSNNSGFAYAADTPSSAAASCGPSSRYVVAYYQTWKRQSLMNIDWSHISHLNVAYAVPTDSGEFTFDGEWFLPQLVNDARKQQTKISLSIGGWTGSNRLSTIMRDTHKRATLIRAIGAFVEHHELDGVDIDWEYVGRQGSKCNKYLPNEDSANLLRFLRALRASFHARFPDSEKLVSLAVRVQPFDGADGPMSDVSPFAEYVDFASITAFDVNGVWSNTTGPNAPLQHQRNRGMPYSFSQSIDQWLAAKWPAEKLVAGVSFYGRSLTTRDVLTAKDGADMYASFDKDVPQGDAEDAYWYDVCENVNSMSGVWQYKHLRDQGILKSANTTGDEWIRIWDEKSNTPWLYNPPMRRFISYDDPDSIDKKVQYAKSKNLKGMMAWSLHSDYNNELVSVLDRLGPLCRGPKSNSDQAPANSTAQASASSASSSASSSSSVTWTPTPPFAMLPTLPSSSTSMATSLASSSSSASASSASAESSASSNSAPPPSSSLSTTATTVSGKIIAFNDVGAPFLVVDGVSTPVPSELAEKLMKITEKTTSSLSAAANATGTAAAAASATLSSATSDPLQTSEANATGASSETSRTDDALPLGPIAIPVVDSAPATSKQSLSQLAFTTVHGPSRPAWNMATNIFDTPLPTTKAAPSTSAAVHDLFLGTPLDSSASGDSLLPSPLSGTPTAVPAGFAATFFLTLDTNTQSTGLQTTTVVPLLQMMASARSEAASSSLQLSPSALTSAPVSVSAASSSTMISDLTATTSSTLHPDI